MASCPTCRPSPPGLDRGAGLGLALSREVALVPRQSSHVSTSPSASTFPGTLVRGGMPEAVGRGAPRTTSADCRSAPPLVIRVTLGQASDSTPGFWRCSPRCGCRRRTGREPDRTPSVCQGCHVPDSAASSRGKMGIAGGNGEPEH